MKIYVFVSMCAIDIIILSVVRVLVVVRSLKKKNWKYFLGLVMKLHELRHKILLTKTKYFTMVYRQTWKSGKIFKLDLVVYSSSCVYVSIVCFKNLLNYWKHMFYYNLKVRKYYEFIILLMKFPVLPTNCLNHKNIASKNSSQYKN